MNAHGPKLSNQYAGALGRLYDLTPKAVFAAVAYSYATWACGEEAKTSEKVVMRLLEEWRVLHENGIVPQKPPTAAPQLMNPRRPRHHALTSTADDTTAPNQVHGRRAGAPQGTEGGAQPDTAPDHYRRPRAACVRRPAYALVTCSPRAYCQSERSRQWPRCSSPYRRDRP